MAHAKERFKKKTAKIAAKDIRIDPRCQRTILPAWLKKITDELDLDRLDVVSVSLREDGHYYSIDGQHRLGALINNGLGDWLVTCHVYMGLTLADEAWLFVKLNETRNVSAWESFDKGLTAGFPDCLAVQRVAERFHISASDQCGDRKLACVAAARAIVGANGEGADLLAWAISVAIDAWGATGSALDGKIIQGLAIFGKKYMRAVDRDSLVKKLSVYAGGPTRLLGAARGESELRGGTVAKNVARVCIARYNTGRRANGQLAEI